MEASSGANLNHIQRLTDFFVCDSTTEAQAAKEGSDLLPEAFDQRIIHDVTYKKDRILVYACSGCGEAKDKR